MPEMNSMSRQFRYFALALMGCLATATACAGPVVEAGQPAVRGQPMAVSRDSSLGQSLLAYQGGLQAIDFTVVTSELGDGSQIAFTLKRSVDTSTTLATGVATLNGSDLRIDFPPQSAERMQDYYIELAATGPGRLTLRAAEADAYTNGSAYVNGIPVERQLSFRLYHEPARLIQGLLGLVGQWLLLGVAAAVMLVAPGLSLLLHVPETVRHKTGLLGLLLLSPAVSTAVITLAITLTGLMGVHAGPAYVFGPIAISVAVLGRTLVRHRRSIFVALRRITKPRASTIGALLVLAIITFTRLWAIRGIEVPLWGDSYQHTMIVQLLLDHGGLFDNWSPYADMTTLTYHIGFHSMAAAFAWLTSLDAARSVLWMGQFLNICAVAAVFPVARRISGSNGAGVVAMAIAGLVSVYPAFFVNWGRYTQLTGLLILPAVIWIIDLDEQSTSGVSRWIVVALGGLLWAGLAMAHYRMLILGMLYAVVRAFVIVLSGKHRIREITTLAAGCLFGLALFAPWLVHSFSGSIPSTGMTLLTTLPAQLDDQIRNYNTAPELSAVLPVWVWILGAFGLVSGLIGRHKTVNALGLWIVIAWVATNPAMLGLSGTGLISNFALYLCAYLPASIISGWVFAATERRFPTVTRSGPTRVLLTAVFIVASAQAAVARTTDTQPQVFGLVQRPDLRAMRWIEANLPADVRLLVNSFPAYGGSLVAGSDGGWWLPVLTHRSTTLPPLNFTNERLPSATYVNEVLAQQAALRTGGLSLTNLELLRKANVTHIYVGQQRGRVGTSEPMMIPYPEIEKLPWLKTVYRQDRVVILEINYAAALEQR